MYLIQISAAYKPAYIYGGPTMSVAKLAEVLSQKAAIQLEVLTTTANGKSELEVAKNTPVPVEGVLVSYFKRLTKDHTHFSPSLLTALNQKLKKAKPQLQENRSIVHIHAWWNLVSLGSCWVAYWNKTPVVLSPRGMLTSYTLSNRNSLFKSILHVLVGKWLLKHCHIHATSRKEQDDILQNFKVKSITVIPNFVQLASTAIAKPSRERATLKLIFLSRIEQKKGLELLFEALNMVTFPWELTIAGSGEANYISTLKNLASHLNIAAQINWIGHVSNSDKFQLLAKHDLLTLTSYNENFANVVVESLSVGTAVLVSQAVGLADYIEEQQLGWICNLVPQDIARQLTYIDKHQAELDHIALRSPEKIQRDFSEEKLVDKYVALYQSVAKQA